MSQLTTLAPTGLAKGTYALFPISAESTVDWESAGPVDKSRTSQWEATGSPDVLKAGSIPWTSEIGVDYSAAVPWDSFGFQQFVYTKLSMLALPIRPVFARLSSAVDTPWESTLLVTPTRFVQFGPHGLPMRQYEPFQGTTNVSQSVDSPWEADNTTAPNRITHMSPMGVPMQQYGDPTSNLVIGQADSNWEAEQGLPVRGTITLTVSTVGSTTVPTTFTQYRVAIAPISTGTPIVTAFLPLSATSYTSGLVPPDTYVCTWSLSNSDGSVLLNTTTVIVAVGGISLQQESLGGLAPNKTTRWESIQPLLRAQTGQWESITGPSRSVASPWETTSSFTAVTHASSCQWESVDTLVPEVSSPWSSTGNVTKARTSAWEALSAQAIFVASGRVTSWESRSPLATPVLNTHLARWEALGNAPKSVTTQYEAVGRIAATSATCWEADTSTPPATTAEVVGGLLGQ